MEILFVAAENGALEGGQVGGLGDVIRELPPALAAAGCRVTTLIPSHGYLHRASGAEHVAACRFRFQGQLQTAAIYELAPREEAPEVAQLVIDHPLLSAVEAGSGRQRIYIHDPPDRPYFSDGTRFACFCAAAAAALCDERLGNFDIIHLHDWHSTLFAVLARFHPDFAPLRQCPVVFSIHNLAYQGIRPFRGSASSLAAWFPELHGDSPALADPRWPDCINPLAAGIRLAQRVHTVSPAYAREIRQPSRKPHFFGGEGLESDLQQAHQEGRLKGILNGCRYPENGPPRQLNFEELSKIIRRELLVWCGGLQQVPSAHFLAFVRLLGAGGGREKPQTLLTAVARSGEQKMRLLRQGDGSGKSALDRILEGIGSRGLCIILGSGDGEYDQFLIRRAAKHDNLIFLNGYSPACAQALYAAGDLFLMPSSFEPCGLSQMLAMAAGQPCLVHAVGGLKDTVRHGRNGFVFGGDTVAEQARNFVTATLEAIALQQNNPGTWHEISKKAAAARFTWQRTAEGYLDQLYNPLS